MFCRNCGKELSPMAEICMACGVRPPAGDGFCNSCGAAVSPLAEMCVKCGARLAVSRPHDVQRPKSKTVAVLLAVFLGFWSWLYTYRQNAGRFWLGLAVCFPCLFFVFIGFDPVIIGLAIGSIKILGYRGSFAVDLWVFVAILAAFWIWSILDTAIKDRNWYSSH